MPKMQISCCEIIFGGWGAPQILCAKKRIFLDIYFEYGINVSVNFKIYTELHGGQVLLSRRGSYGPASSTG